MKSKINNNKSTKVSNNSDSQDQSNSSLSVYEELKLLKKENEVLKKVKSLGKDLWLKSTKARKNKKIYNKVKADKNLRLTQVLKEFSIPISTFYYELKKRRFWQEKWRNYKPNEAYFWRK